MLKLLVASLILLVGCGPSFSVGDASRASPDSGAEAARAADAAGGDAASVDGPEASGVVHEAGEAEAVVEAGSILDAGEESETGARYCCVTTYEDIDNCAEGTVQPYGAWRCSPSAGPESACSLGEYCLDPAMTCAGIVAPCPSDSGTD